MRKNIVQNRKIKDLRELKGKVMFAKDYDYKKMRLKNDFSRYFRFDKLSEKSKK